MQSGRDSILDVLIKYQTNKDVYHDLMKFRVRKLLLVSTMYESFILEEEGKMAEQVFGEYYQLNLSSAPRISSAYSTEQAIEKVSHESFDMVIIVRGGTLFDSADIAREIKFIKPDIPILVLLNSNADIHSCGKDNESMKYINKIFVWNGNSKVLLAMIKYVEDYFNVHDDVQTGNVQIILLVEDSIRYYSRYLPELYTAIIKQTQRLIMSEDLNEQEKILRMRARPRVLMAETYEEAVSLFDKYQENILCVISDNRYLRNKTVDPTAGVAFLSYVKAKKEGAACLLQTSEDDGHSMADSVHAAFINKNSETLVEELQKYISRNLGFGPFTFRNSKGDEIAHANNFDGFEKVLKVISDETLLYHGSRDHFSAWFMARGEIKFAKALKNLKVNNFDNINDIRTFILTSLQNVKLEKIKGKVVNFKKEIIDCDNCIARLASGSLGGKGRGVAFISYLIAHADISSALEKGIDIKIPKTAIIGTDEFDNITNENHLFDSVIHDNDHDSVKRKFLSANLSIKLWKRLKILLEHYTGPIAVRSSGLFEDMLSQPFAGIYSTYILPNNHHDIKERLRQLSCAIKLVYASVYSPLARSYFNAVGYKIEEEKMAVIIQELVGAKHGDLFYPHISGIAQSYNYYPVGYLKPEDGIAVAAVGLGSYVVEGEQAYRFSPSFPKMDIISQEHLFQSSQQEFYAVDLSEKIPDIFKGEEFCYKRLPISEADKHGVLNHLASTIDINNNTLVPGTDIKGPRVINFANILKYDIIPLANVISSSLDYGALSLGSPVEIEWAVNQNSEGKWSFYILQLKPLIKNEGKITEDVTLFENESLILKTNRAMGNGTIDSIRDIVFVDDETFDKSKTNQIAQEVGHFNRKLSEQGKKYILIGPGRWGTRDSWLGIPVSFTQISSAGVIVETAMEDYQIDASLGSHFFHNITSMNIGYFTVPWGEKNSFVDYSWLKNCYYEEKTEFCRHISFGSNTRVVMDGRKGMAVIVKPS